MNMNKVIDNEFEDLYFLVVSILDNHPIIIVIEQGWVNSSFSFVFNEFVSIFSLD